MTALPLLSLRRSCLLALLAFLALATPRIGFADDDDKASPLAPSTPLSGDAFANLNNTVRGLGGLDAYSGGDSETPWQSTSEWKSYQSWLDGRWGYMNRVRLNAMKSWSGSALGDLRDESHTVFYPFSGPDFLYADTFFPHSKYLVMAGLEPVGTLPNLAELQDHGKLGSYLQQVQTSLSTILAASFFKTKDMKNDFNNDLVNGLMPAMVVFLAREGYTIDSVTYVNLTSNGTLAPKGSKSGAPGVQIAYFKGDRDELCYLLYFQADLGNDGLSSNPGYIKLMQRLGPGITYLKAASYLLYEDYFSKIRNAILDNSIGVVEDDSGIPFKYFNPSQWEVIPYGNYTGPIQLFHEHFQPDLEAYYSHTSHSALPFGSGYKFVASVSSLLVAKKKEK